MPIKIENAAGCTLSDVVHVEATGLSLPNPSGSRISVKKLNVSEIDIGR